MSTSGLHIFGSAQNRVIIEDAYERAGVAASKINEELIDSAQRSLNFILQEWTNKGNNLWTIKQAILGLNESQRAYTLDASVSDIKTAAVRTSTRNLGGTAASSSGVAANAFDNNTATACTQDAANGYISYNWGSASYAIEMVGIQSNSTRNYTILGQYSYTGNDGDWVTVLTIPRQSYTLGVLNWFAVPVPTTASYFRIVENSDPALLIFLDIQELYFNTSLVDSVLARVSEDQYNSYPNKNLISKPSVYWIDRQITPILYLYPTPGVYTVNNTVLSLDDQTTYSSFQYNAVFYTYWQTLQDIGSMQNSPDVPSRLVEALCSALAARLGLKTGLPLDKLLYLDSLATAKYAEAAKEDTSRVGVRIAPSGFGGHR